MAERVKKGPVAIAVIALIAAGIFGPYYYFTRHGEVTASKTVNVTGDLHDVELEEASASPAAVSGAFVPPTNALAAVKGPQVKHLGIPWNALTAHNLANGGPKTTKGSLMEKYGVNLTVERQDMYPELQNQLVACATELSQGAKNCTNGAQFVTIMGDAGAAFFAELNDKLGKLGPEYKAKIIASFGASYGEDKFMAPPSVKEKASNAKGLLISGVLRDGDWNIALYFARQNKICNNPDVTTYNPECLNWFGTDDFVQADEKYIQGYCEERPVVKTDAESGKTHRTGETKKVCVNAVVTWTPGDVAIAEKKGGLVSVLSTRENDTQMPQVFIGIPKWYRANKVVTKAIMRASFEAADQIKSHKTVALKRGAEANAKVFNEGDFKYWMKYFKGVEEVDQSGATVSLGGSRVFNLADNLRYYGIEEGYENAYAASYTLFGKIAQEQYPELLPSFPAVSEVLDLSLLKELAAELQGVGEAIGKADDTTFEEGTVGETIAKRSWNIGFETGKATFTPDTQSTLNTLLEELLIAGNTVVEVHGHTDNTGSPSANQTLSERRANAVGEWLKGKASGNFPKGKLRIYAHGQSQPLVDLDTSDARAKNRRVEIVLKTNQASASTN